MCSTLDLCKCPGELRREGEEIALCLVKEYWVGFQIDDLPQNAMYTSHFCGFKNVWPYISNFRNALSSFLIEVCLAIALLAFSQLHSFSPNS